MDAQELVKEIAHILGVEPTDHEAMLQVARNAALRAKNSQRKVRISEIVAYIAPDRVGQHMRSFGRAVGSLRYDGAPGLAQPHPDLPQWWWNAASLSTRPVVFKDGSVKVYLESYEGGGNMSNAVEFTIPKEWMEVPAQNDKLEVYSLYRLIDAHAEIRRAEKFEERRAAERAQVEKEEAEDRAKLAELQAKYGVQS